MKTQRLDDLLRQLRFRQHLSRAARHLVPPSLALPTIHLDDPIFTGNRVIADLDAFFSRLESANVKVILPLQRGNISLFFYGACVRLKPYRKKLQFYLVGFPRSYVSGDGGGNNDLPNYKNNAGRYGIDVKCRKP